MPSSLALGYKKGCHVYPKFSNYSREKVNRAGWFTTLPKRVEQAITSPQFVLSRERLHLLHAKRQSRCYKSKQSLIWFSPRNVQERVLNGILVKDFWKYSSAIAAHTNPSFEGLTSNLANGYSPRETLSWETSTMSSTCGWFILVPLVSHG